MNTHTDRAHDAKSPAPAQRVHENSTSAPSTLQFKDQRPEARDHEKLSHLAETHTAVKQFRSFEVMANNSDQVTHLNEVQSMANESDIHQNTAQLQKNADAYTAEQPTLQKKENKTGLPSYLKTGIETLSGLSMDDVKVNYNSEKPAQLNAHAYAQGTNIHLGAGQEKHLPHEAWHVVQQKQGRVQPTIQTKSNEFVNDDPGLEREADTMGAQAAQLKSRNPDGAASTISTRPLNSGQPVKQLAEKEAPIQLKANILRTKSTMTAVFGGAMRGLTITSNSRRYEDVIAAVINYESDEDTPDDNYGMQLVQLDEIARLITVWETGYGAVETVDTGMSKLGKTARRRSQLLLLKGTIPGERTAVRAQGKVAADAQHGRDRQALNDHIAAGIGNEDLRLSNTCDWITNTDKTKVYAVTPTGDTYARILAAGMDPAVDTAFFPGALAGSAGDVKSAAVSYTSTDLANNTNVLLKANGRHTGGWQTDGNVAITNAENKGQQATWNVLRHEVQHDADKHYGRDSSTGLRRAGEGFEATGASFNADGQMNPLVVPGVHMLPNGGGVDWVAHGFTLDQATGFPDAHAMTPEQDVELQTIVAAIHTARADFLIAKLELDNSHAENLLERYKTEYRAYSYEETANDPTGTFNQLDNTVQNQDHDGFNFTERQLAIFQHIYNEYDHTKEGWDDNPALANGSNFRTAVSAYWNPDTEGFNKFNSRRVDDFYNALDAISAKLPATRLETNLGKNVAPVDQTTKVSTNDHVDVIALLVIIGNLSADDADYILNQSQVWRPKIDQHLADPAKTTVITAIQAIH